MEKDFWVCLVLKILFVNSAFKDSLVFKGGTSLSKVYGLIDRFSEDIDLVLDWKTIGFGEHDPMRSIGSKTKQIKFNREINQAAARFIAETLCPQIDNLVQKEKLGLTAVIDSADPQVVNIHYPAAFFRSLHPAGSSARIGPLAAWVPSSPFKIRPYVFDVFPRNLRGPQFVRRRNSRRADILGKKQRFFTRKHTGQRLSQSAIPAIIMTCTSSR